MAGYRYSSRRLRQCKPHSGRGGEAGESARHLSTSRTFRRARNPDRRLVGATRSRAGDSLTFDAPHMTRMKGGPMWSPDDGGMRKEGYMTVRIAVALFTVCLVACGGGSTGHLLPISISPPTANGANFPLGGVQFTATGTFDKAPVTVTPLTATWSISPSGIASIGTSDGFAQCISTGTATITASAPVTQGSSTMVSGTATLTCP